MAQDDYYYEIQLTNKQLIFYFLAGASALILSFLAGVMVGRGVESGDIQTTTPPREARIVAEEPRPSPPPAEELTYARTLESDRPPESLDRTRPGTSEDRVPATAAAAPAATARQPRATQPAPVTSAPAAPATTAPPAAPPTTRPPPPPTTQAPPPTTAPRAYDGVPNVPGNFSIQVGAFKDRASADGVMGQLKEKGYPAYVVGPAGGDGLFNVRVGSFTARADAERFQARLRDEEKFQPFLVRQ